MSCVRNIKQVDLKIYLHYGGTTHYDEKRIKCDIFSWSDDIYKFYKYFGSEWNSDKMDHDAAYIRFNEKVYKLICLFPTVNTIIWNIVYNE